MTTLPHAVQFILDEFQSAGSVGYIVGGCVRDALLGKEPNDWDICTPLTPDEVKDVFKEFQVIDTGIKHGTVTVIVDKVPYEITTFRTDGEYSDGRHPDNVTFTKSLEEDLARRDFTINAMAYNEAVGLVDIFGGCFDLRHGIIRCVRNPEERFEEDALRILRAMRFAACLGFSIEEDTANAMNDLRENLNSVSKERISSELMKMFSTTDSDSLSRIMWAHAEIFGEIIPELQMLPFKTNSVFQRFDIYSHTVEAMRTTTNDPIVRMAILFHDIGKPYFENDSTNNGHCGKSVEISKDIMKRLRFENNVVREVAQLIERHEYHTKLYAEDRKAISEGSMFQLRKAIHEIGFEQSIRLIAVCRANVKAHSFLDMWRYLTTLDIAEKMLYQIKNSNECCDLKSLQISGIDLLELGVKPGKDIGRILNELLEVVMLHPYMNQHNWLLKIAEERMKNSGNNIK